MLTRRQFVSRQSRTFSAALAGGVLMGAGGIGFAQDDQQAPSRSASSPKRDRPPRLDLEMVQEFVAVAHSNLSKVQELYQQQPRLVNATHDWGAGDFETALGAAAHTGQREIALYLLEHGARLDIFAATMLGQLEIVKATLQAFPQLINTPGPHGIPLVSHAKAGKEGAAEVLAYLETLVTEKSG